MRTKILIVTASLGLALASAHAQTNSWIDGSDYWDVDEDWSLGVAPSSSQFGIFITNATSKTVTLDSDDSSFFPNT